MKNQANNNLTSFADHLDEQYGKRGTETRENYEQGFEALKLGVFIQELREQQNMTQEQLAANATPQNRIFQELKIMPVISGCQHLCVL